jgi:3-methyl-2-oxobutanoate hydroxymethyltransferase
MTAHPAAREQRVTPGHIRSKKGRQRITFVTAYDFPTAKLADEAGFDMVLVGDTLAEVVLGHDTTLPVSFETMLHHTSAARRGIKGALLVADLPYGTYHASEEDAVRFGVRFVKEGGAQAVKLEGGRKTPQCNSPDAGRRDSHDGTHRPDASIRASYGRI